MMLVTCTVYPVASMSAGSTITRTTIYGGLATPISWSILGCVADHSNKPTQPLY